MTDSTSVHRFISGAATLAAIVCWIIAVGFVWNNDVTPVQHTIVLIVLGVSLIFLWNVGFPEEEELWSRYTYVVYKFVPEDDVDDGDDVDMKKATYTEIPILYVSTFDNAKRLTSMMNGSRSSGDNFHYDFKEHLLVDKTFGDY